GALSLGIYQDSLAEEVRYLISYADVKVVMCEDEEQADKVLEVVNDCPSVQYIIYHDPRGMRKYDDPRLTSQEELLRRGEELGRQEPGLYRRLVEEGEGDAVAMLITTSGTTSHPKLAMLRSQAFLDHCMAYLRADPKYPGDNYVSVLPLPWIMEQVYAVAQAL